MFANSDISSETSMGLLCEVYQIRGTDNSSDTYLQMINVSVMHGQYFHAVELEVLKVQAVSA